MNSNNSTTVTFNAIAKEIHPSGKAVLLLECKQGTELLFERVYMPLSQTRMRIVNKKTKEVSITIPEWLFESKLEDEAAFKADNAVLDQLGLLTEDDANLQIAETVDNSFRDTEQA